ncbi:MAG: aldose 1-epimerase [Acetobacteraceae bacterium]|nr:aldose 1-epimerase [Acetobacteraceae bacterium]
MITLRLKDCTLVVAPESGGATAGWTHGATRLLRMPLSAAVLHGDVHGMACFPLLPYANRIGQARFDWDGRPYQLRRNIPGQPHALHGVGWARPWQVEALTDTAIRLSLRHDPVGEAAADWPFAFTAEQRIALLPEGMRITLALTSAHDGPAPAGLGLHPYFPRGTGATLRFAADGVWRNDATVLPHERTAIPPEWDHAAGQAIGSTALDNCFTGWPRRAAMAWDTHKIAIEADVLFDHLQVYTPPGQDFFAVEPVSHAPDAINRPGPDGMRILAHGETLSGSVTFRME